MRVGVISRLDRSEALDCMLKIVEELLGAGFEVVLEFNAATLLAAVSGLTGRVSVETINGFHDVDAIVVVGGDGTVLRASQYLPSGSKILGVRIGRKGFLTGFECGDNVAEYLSSGRIVWCSVTRLCTQGLTPPALNEIVVQAARGKTVLVETRVKCGGWSSTAMYRGDGTVLATPLGSYAYSLSAGGPLAYCSDCIVITPLTPLPGSAEPIVAAGACQVDVRIVEGYRAAWIIVDGQFSTPVPIGTSFTAKQCKPIAIGYKDRCPWPTSILETGHREA